MPISMPSMTPLAIEHTHPHTTMKYFKYVACAGCMNVSVCNVYTMCVCECVCVR